MTATQAIKAFFERKDAIAPNGGREMQPREMLEFAKSNEKGATFKLGIECAKELGVEIDAPATV